MSNSTTPVTLPDSIGRARHSRALRTHRTAADIGVANITNVHPPVVGPVPSTLARTAVAMISMTRRRRTSPSGAAVAR